MSASSCLPPEALEAPLTWMVVEEFCALRIESGYTIAKLARYSGIRRSTLEAIEAHRERPTLRTVERLCAGLEIPLEMVLAGARRRMKEHRLCPLPRRKTGFARP